MEEQVRSCLQLIHTAKGLYMHVQKIFVRAYLEEHEA